MPAVPGKYPDSSSNKALPGKPVRADELEYGGAARRNGGKRVSKDMIGRPTQFRYVLASLDVRSRA
jgi:hypothetical protein